MKKGLLTALLMIVCQLTFAQTATDVFNEYKDVRHAETATVPKAFLRIGANKVSDQDLKILLKEIDIVQILDLDDSSSRNRKGFATKINKLTSYGYQEYARMQKGKEQVLALTLTNGNVIKEIVVLSTDKDDCSAVLVKGNMRSEDISAILGMIEDSDAYDD